MRTLIFGAGPIGRWLALRLHQAEQSVTLLARGETHRSLEQRGIEIVDGLTGERFVAKVKLVDRAPTVAGADGVRQVLRLARR